MMLVLLSPLLLLMPSVLAVVSMNRLPLLLAAATLLLQIAVASHPAAEQQQVELRLAVPSSLQMLPTHSAKSSSR
jgi:hypothetical protein